MNIIQTKNLPRVKTVIKFVTCKVMNVIIEDCRHLKLLDFRATAFGQENDDVDPLQAANRPDGWASGVAGSAWLEMIKILILNVFICLVLTKGNKGAQISLSIQ